MTPFPFVHVPDLRHYYRLNEQQKSYATGIYADMVKEKEQQGQQARDLSPQGHQAVLATRLRYGFPSILYRDASFIATYGDIVSGQFTIDVKCITKDTDHLQVNIHDLPKALYLLVLAYGDDFFMVGYTTHKKLIDNSPVMHQRDPKRTYRQYPNEDLLPMHMFEAVVCGKVLV